MPPGGQQRYFGKLSHNPASNGHESLSNLSSLDLRYSHEGRDFGRALETAGGIVRALPLLDEVFWVLAGDVFAPQFDFAAAERAAFAASAAGRKLWRQASEVTQRPSSERIVCACSVYPSARQLLGRSQRIVGRLQADSRANARRPPRGGPIAQGNSTRDRGLRRCD